MRCKACEWPDDDDDAAPASSAPRAKEEKGKRGGGAPKYRKSAAKREKFENKLNRLSFCRRAGRRWGRAATTPHHTTPPLAPQRDWPERFSLQTCFSFRVVECGEYPAPRSRNGRLCAAKTDSSSLTSPYTPLPSHCLHKRAIRPNPTAPWRRRHAPFPGAKNLSLAEGPRIVRGSWWMLPVRACACEDDSAARLWFAACSGINLGRVCVWGGDHDEWCIWVALLERDSKLYWGGAANQRRRAPGACYSSVLVDRVVTFGLSTSAGRALDSVRPSAWV